MSHCLQSSKRCKFIPADNHLAQAKVMRCIFLTAAAAVGLKKEQTQGTLGRGVLWWPV